MADVTPRNPVSGSANTKKKGASQPGSLGLDVRDPDAFQDTLMDGWQWVEKHSGVAFAALGILVVGAIVFATISWWGRHQEKKVQESFYKIDAKYTKIKEDFDKAKYESAMAKPKTDKAEDTTPTPKAATGDLDKDYGSLIGDFEKLARENPSTSAGAEAAIIAANTYLNYAKPDKAAEVAQIPVKGLGDSSLLANLARMIWGTAVATKGDCKEAVQIWKPLIDNSSVTFLAGDASLRSGLCYETLGQTEDARKMYEKVSAGGGGPEAGSSNTAKGLLRALDLKTKSASPAPAPAKG